MIQLRVVHVYMTPHKVLSEIEMRGTVEFGFFLRDRKQTSSLNFSPAVLNLPCGHRRVWSKHCYFQEIVQQPAHCKLSLYNPFHSHWYWPKHYSQCTLNYVKTNFRSGSEFSPVTKIVWNLEIGKQLTGCFFQCNSGLATLIEFILVGLFYNHVQKDMNMQIFVR